MAHVDLDRIARVAASLHVRVRDMLRAGPAHSASGGEPTVNAKGDIQAWFDIEADRIAIDTLRQEFGCGVLWSEEQSEPIDLGGPGPTFVIDPVDGSTNAKRGIPCSGFALGAIPHGEPVCPEQVVFGLVGPLEPGHALAAAAGQGCYVVDESGKPIGPPCRVRPDGPLDAAMLGADWSGRLPPGAERIAAHVAHMRSFGASTRSIALVAAGSIDAHIDLRGRLTPENYLAPSRLVLEAGGLVRGHDGHPIPPVESLLDRRPFVACAGEQLLEGLIELLNMPA
ncbi:MAG: inositol monophosphatase family protein [Planctomycetota bacterium]